jgi:DNA modification methylase
MGRQVTKRPAAKASRLAVEHWPIDRLKAYAKNARTHSKEQVDQIAASMREFGFVNPVGVDRQGTLIWGHGRILAAAQLGMATVPVIRLGHLSDAQARVLRIADNQIALNAGWDLELLKFELLELKGGGFDLGLLGFNPDELFQYTDSPTGVDPEATPEPPKNPVSQLGDLWRCGNHSLLCGDSTKADDVARLLGKAKPHLMVTDPPYGVDYDPAWRAKAGVNKSKKKMGLVANDKQIDWGKAWDLFPGDIVYVWHADRHASEVQNSLMMSGFNAASQIIWAKDRLALSRGDYHWQHEPAWYCVRAGKNHRWAGDRSQTTLWAIPARDDAGHGHGTQKPIECMRRPIANNSHAGDSVYDPFCGSGTTIIAAEMTGRHCLAIEIAPEYVDVGVLRWQKFADKKATLDGDGRTFAEVAAARKKTKRTAPKVVSSSPGKNAILPAPPRLGVRK